jgi:hypothetical protein
MLLPGLAGIMLLPLPVMRAFLAGVLCTSAVAILVFWVVLASGSVPMMMGETAEQWTAAELRRIPGAGWRLVNGVRLGRGDIDHVLVGPGGLFVVEISITVCSTPSSTGHTLAVRTPYSARRFLFLDSSET